MQVTLVWPPCDCESVTAATAATAAIAAAAVAVAIAAIVATAATWMCGAAPRCSWIFHLSSDSLVAPLIQALSLLLLLPVLLMLPCAPLLPLLISLPPPLPPPLLLLLRWVATACAVRTFAQAVSATINPTIWIKCGDSSSSSCSASTAGSPCNSLLMSSRAAKVNPERIVSQGCSMLQATQHTIEKETSKLLSAITQSVGGLLIMVLLWRKHASTSCIAAACTAAGSTSPRSLPLPVCFHTRSNSNRTCNSSVARSAMHVHALYPPASFRV